MTQFELATAAAFVALAAARVEAAVIEAGLGGRLDATNTIPSRVTVLTSVGLDHTEWLGETEEEIAAEKLAVLRDHSTLVLGRVSPAVARAGRAHRRASAGAKLVVAPEDPGPEIALRAAGRFQRRNFALALRRRRGLPRRARSRARRRGRGEPEIPGRLERVADEPPTFLDAAHNPDGAAALAEALPEVAGGRPGRRLPGGPRRQGRARDGRGRWRRSLELRRLHRAPRRVAAGATEPAPARLATSAGRAGAAVRARRAFAAEAEPDLGCRGAAGARASLASSGGVAPRHRLPLRAGAALAQRDSAYARIECMDRSAGSELLSMMALVAAVVAAVILVFFGLGYLFGSLFL